MDPKANLEEQIKLASAMLTAGDNGQRISETDAYRLAELVIALDEWRMDGGFDPYNFDV